MKNTYTLAQVVKTIMQEDKQTRNSDGFLYLKVLEVYAKANECPISLYSMSVVHFLTHMKEYGFPPFESVRRNRQLIQAKYPELAASDPIDAHRLVKEEEMIDYVREAKYGV
jgi:hypothetical protein